MDTIKPADLKRVVKMATPGGGVAGAWTLEVDDEWWFATRYFARKMDLPMFNCLASFNIDANAPQGIMVNGSSVTTVDTETPAFQSILERAAGQCTPLTFHETIGGRMTVARSFDRKGKATDLYVVAEEANTPLTFLEPDYAHMVGALDDGVALAGSDALGVIAVHKGDEMTGVIMPVRPS